uniref:Uncharacterized protein MANES_11G107800 n=1 Tax=Rhizophora mucronata TaxID=61149 RepID=A0A2P2KSG7_RHIMU
MTKLFKCFFQSSIRCRPRKATNKTTVLHVLWHISPSIRIRLKIRDFSDSFHRNLRSVINLKFKIKARENA